MNSLCVCLSNHFIGHQSIWLLAKAPMLTTMALVHQPNVSLAILVVFLQGVASSSSLIFISSPSLVRVSESSSFH